MFKAFIKETSFGIFLILIILAIGFVYISSPIFGNRTLIVRSGSMEPTIKTGDLVAVKNANSFKVGDVISFKSVSKPNVLITHRIVGEQKTDEKVFYQTKGDNNKNIDKELVSSENIVGTGFLRIPYVGKLIAFTKTKVGFAGIILFPAFLVIGFELYNLISEIKKQKNKQSGLSQNNTVLERIVSIPPMIEILGNSQIKRNFGFGLRFQDLKVVLPIIVSLLVTYNTFSYFSDTALSDNNSFAAATSFPSPSPTPNIGNIVINEVYYDVDPNKGDEGTSQNPDEWIELYNPTSSTINIKDWSITDNFSTDSVSSANVFVPAGGFVLIAKSNSTWSNWDEDPDADKVPIGDKIGNGLANDGDIVILRDNGGNIIDQMSWGTNTGAFNPSTTDVVEGHSLERDPDGVDTNTAADFVDRTIPTPGS